MDLTAWECNRAESCGEHIVSHQARYSAKATLGKNSDKIQVNEFHSEMDGQDPTGITYRPTL